MWVSIFFIMMKLLYFKVWKEVILEVVRNYFVSNFNWKFSGRLLGKVLEKVLLILEGYCYLGIF